MKATQNTYMYSFEYPYGKHFTVDSDIPDGFVDTPAKLGINRLDSKEEVERKCQEGLKISIKKEEQIIDQDQDSMDDLKKQYEEKFGKKPFHLMKEEGLRKALNAS